MSVASLICNEIYSAFLVIKDGLESLVELVSIGYDLLYKIVSKIGYVISTAISDVINIAQELINSILSDLCTALSGELGNLQWCANAFKCDILIDMVLNPDSLIGKMIAKVVNDEDDCYCYRDVRPMQEALYKIANDYRAFRQQLCIGLNVDFLMTMVKDLVFSTMSTVNKAIRWVKGKYRFVQKKLQALLDQVRIAGIFYYLDLLEGFFNCIIDSDACSNVETAKGYYAYMLGKLQLIKTGKETYSFTMEFMDSVASAPRGALSKLNLLGYSLKDLSQKFTSPSALTGAKNSFDLSASIHMIGKDIYNNGMGALTKIPVFTWTKQSIKSVRDAYKSLAQTTAKDTDDAMTNSNCVTTDKAMNEVQATETTGDYLYCDTDNAHAADLMEFDGNIYTVAEVAKMTYEGTLPQKLKNFLKEVAGYMNLDDVLVRLG